MLDLAGFDYDYENDDEDDALRVCRRFTSSVCFLPAAAFGKVAVMNSHYRDSELIRMAESVKLCRANILSLGPHLPKADSYLYALWGI